MALLIYKQMHKLRYVLPECPNEAISIGEEIYVIDPMLWAGMCRLMTRQPAKVCRRLQTVLSQILSIKKAKSSFGKRFVMIHHSDKL